MFQSASRIAAGVLRRAAAVTPSVALQAQFRMSSSGNTRYDLVVYGATGFTGQYVVEEVARVAEKERIKLGAKDATLQWAVAGRNKSKLLAALEEARKETGLSLSGVGLLEADVGDTSSLDKMTAQAKVVINCVGPYMKYGEPVVVSCIQNGASHVDISGEGQFLEGMQLRHHKEAEDKGVHIVGACGYDSIPAEMGVHYLGQQFPGGLNSVETYMRTRSSGGATPIHTGTLESALFVIANKSAAAAQLKQLFPTKLPKPKFRMPSRSIIHNNPVVKSYGVPMPGDEPVVYRTQRYRHDVLHQQTVQFKQYLSCKSWLHGLGFMMGLLYFVAMASMDWTRKLVLKYPEMMTAGIFSRAGASRESLKGLSFTMTLVGQGWSDRLTEPTDQHSSPPDVTKILKVEGSDPGYSATSLMLVASAMTILREKEACTATGGVLTPGIAFANTNLLQRLRDRGMKFDMQE